MVHTKQPPQDWNNQRSNTQCNKQGNQKNPKTQIHEYIIEIT